MNAERCMHNDLKLYLSSGWGKVNGINLGGYQWRFKVIRGTMMLKKIRDPVDGGDD